MPYDSIDDLPNDQTDQYTREQKQAFRRTFNNAVGNGEDERTAFAKAHDAAKKEGD